MNFLRIVRNFFLALTLTATPCYASMDFDDFDELDFDLNAIQDFENDCLLTRTTPAQGLTLALLGQIKSPLWNNTQAPKGRDVLYLLPHKITAIEHGGFAASYFFNMTDKMQVSADSLLDTTSINPELIKFITDYVAQNAGNNVSSEELLTLLPLFQKMRIQERKTGFFLQGAFLHGPFTLQLHTSLQLSERNFFLSKKDELQALAVLEKVRPGQSVDNKEFFIIRYGMGDTRLKLGLNSLNMTSFKVDTGFEAILPTSLAVSNPRFTEASLKVSDIDQLTESLLDQLRGIRDFLLNPQLGNGGHFGVGYYLESKVGIFRNLAHLWFRFSYDKLFPGQETRLLMFKQTIDPEKLNMPGYIIGLTDPEAAQLIQDYIDQFVFPTPFKSNVYPGGIFNIVMSAVVNAKPWQVAFGYDFYAQQRERIVSIKSSRTQLSDLRVKDAELPSTNQHKFFTEVCHIKKHKKSEITLGLGGDVTMYSINIGKDWTAYFKFAMSF
ncbi:hypothetical protein K2X40_04500 [Candidatus Babeliales bacterium]|nr:hypothetical protein [Candidatus Babeliales bacterium]